VFDYDPTIEAGAEMLGRRGEDHRLDRDERRTNVERREQLAARRAYEAEARAARERGEEPPPAPDWTFEEYDEDDVAPADVPAGDDPSATPVGEDDRA
jgi:GTP-binding protein